MKQGVLDGIFTNIRSLHRAKAKGIKVGSLKFLTEYNSVNLKQYGISYKIIGKDKIKIQGCKKPFKVNGLKQITGLGEYDLSNAKLLKTADGYIVAITVYITRQPENTKELIGVDFGCQTSLTLSNGVKRNCVVEEHDRIKRLKRQASRQVKRSNNNMKTWSKIRKLNAKLSRKRDDAANKIMHELSEYTVVMQDEQINEWKRRHGKKVQYGILGRVKSRLSKKEDTIVLSKWLPTTKLCTCCGKKVHISLYDRVFSCPQCGQEMDRDVHAAQNMIWLYENIVGTGHTEVTPVEFDEMLKGYFAEHNQEAAKSLV
jgi:transposase